MEDGIVILETPCVRVVRTGRHIVAELKTAHRVISTSAVNGGIASDLTHLINHQSCEAAGHTSRFEEIMALGQINYHHAVCDEMGISGSSAATMGTAANMQYAAVKEAVFEEFSVHAIVTAGVTGNAGRAGDPAVYVERNGEYAKVPVDGTINTIVLINAALSDAALSRAVVTMTEAKSAILQELAIRSRVSEGIATGTGTDQFCIACLVPPEDSKPITWTGKHSKMGELIGCAVKDATREALRWQNGMEMSFTRNLFHALEAFGFTETYFKSRLKDELSEDDYTFIMKNYKPVIFEPQVAAAAYALAAVKDRAGYGVLPENVVPEALVSQCAILAATLAAKPAEFPGLRRALMPFVHGELKELIFQAVLLGWQAKWT